MVQDELLHTTVRRLRRKIEPDPTRPCRVSTRRGRGYLEAPIGRSLELAWS